VISVFIVAAAPALRRGLRTMLEQAGFQVVGESVDLPQASGADVLLLAAEAVPDDVPESLPLVLLAADVRQVAALQALGLPGWALLAPDAAADRLAASVQAAAQGLVVLPAENAGIVAPPVEVSDPLQEPLTPRELEVLQLVSHGLSNKLIARALAISEHTVKFHVSSTYAKLGAASRTEAVSLAARKGLISL
jgi:DNA-binding NarL/FixJ family response regulator